MRDDSEIIENRINSIKNSIFYKKLEDDNLFFNDICFSLKQNNHSGKSTITKTPFDSEPLYIKPFIAVIAHQMINRTLPCNGNYITITIGDIDIVDKCEINKEILNTIKPQNVVLKIQEKDSIIIPFISLNLKTFKKTVYCMQSSSLDLKKDNVFLRSIAQGLSEHNIKSNFEDIKIDPVWHLQQIEIIGY